MQPDLESAADIEIVTENSRAVQATFTAGLQEEVRELPGLQAAPSSIAARVSVDGSFRLGLG